MLPMYRLIDYSAMSGAINQECRMLELIVAEKGEAYETHM